MKFSLGSIERIKSRKVVEQLFTEGKGFSVFPFRVAYLFCDFTEGNLKAGFSIGVRHFKKAVDRNRIKRLMKESYRLQKEPLCEKLKQKNQCLAVFFIYTGKELPLYEAVNGKMTAIIKRLMILIDENFAANS